jgi:hypothetical protein
MTDKHDTADLIKLLAIVAAVPRWVDALMKGDGVPMPQSWLWLWTYVSAFMSIGLAAAEVLAANYLFNAWRNQRDRKSNWTLLSTAFCLAIFVVILTPNVAAAVRSVRLADVLGGSWLWWLWSGSVAASSFVIAGAVGLAQKRQDTGERVAKVAMPDNAILPSLTNYDEFTAMMASGNGDRPTTVKELASRYGVKQRTAYRWWQRWQDKAKGE